MTFFFFRVQQVPENAHHWPRNCYCDKRKTHEIPIGISFNIYIVYCIICVISGHAIWIQCTDESGGTNARSIPLRFVVVSRMTRLNFWRFLIYSLVVVFSLLCSPASCLWSLLLWVFILFAWLHSESSSIIRIFLCNWLTWPALHIHTYKSIVQW